MQTALHTIHERLAEARCHLQCLDRVRSFTGDPRFGKTIEQRIVWRELLDLELQDLDEQIERICESARSLSVGLPGSSAPTVTKSLKPHAP